MSVLSHFDLNGLLFGLAAFVTIVRLIVVSASSSRTAEFYDLGEFYIEVANDRLRDDKRVLLRDIARNKRNNILRELLLFGFGLLLPPMLMAISA